MPRGTITERLKITLQNILVHRSWPVEWSPRPHPERWIPVNLQETTENSSLSTLLDLKKTKKKHLSKSSSFSLYLLLLLACAYLNNVWDLVLWALPLSVYLFKMNRFMYSPIYLWIKAYYSMTKCKCKYFENIHCMSVFLYIHNKYTQ